MHNRYQSNFIRSMTHCAAAVASVLVVTFFCGSALAQSQSQTKTTAKPAGKTKHVGLGIIVGEPTGIDLKWFLASGHAIEGAAAWSLSGDNDFHIQGEYLFHNYDLIEVKQGRMPLFFGVGARLILRENVDNTFGIRIPVGLAYEFAGAPFDVFVEVVPILDLTPDTDFDLEGALGARFWF